MNLIGRSKLEKLRRKNRGNRILSDAIDEFIHDIETGSFSNPKELNTVRPDADLVHSDGFYFFNLHIHRTMVLVEFEETGEATIVWCGHHDEYELVFKNNKTTVAAWLRNQGYIN